MSSGYAYTIGIPKICGGNVRPCPKCGCWLLAQGKTYSIGTPKIIRWYRNMFRHGVTCVSCGNYAPSVKIWNRRADRGTR